jgi:putative transcriptional regulator
MSKAFDNIMDGLEGALAYTEGDKAAKVHVIEVVDVKAIREKTGLTQPAFSKAFLVPVGTLRNWEQGRTQPDGPAKALMRIIDQIPDLALKALHTA